MLDLHMCVTLSLSKNAVVTAMSSNCQPNDSGTVLRRTQDGSRIPVPCPQSIISYNAYMGGVDRGDQLRGYYCCKIRSRKFYKYIFYFLLDVAITNSYILVKHHTTNSSKVKIKNFRTDLAKIPLATENSGTFSNTDNRMIPLCC